MNNTKCINVLMIANSASLGGASQSLLDTIKSLKNRVNFTVIIPKSGSLEEKIVKLGASCFIIPFRTGYGKINQFDEDDRNEFFYDNFSAAKKIIPIIEEKKISLIHTNSSVVDVGAFLALMVDLPHIWHIREAIREHYGMEYFDLLLKKQLFRKSNCVISISDYVKSYLINNYSLISTKIYNGIDIERYICSFNEMSKTNDFMIIGNISSDKGQWDAVRAVKKIVDNYRKDFRLFIIGNSEETYFWKLKKYIDKNNLTSQIIFVPFQDDLRKWREKFAFTIITSKAEALGRAAIESMLAGNIIIGAASGATAELIGEDTKKRGFLYEKGNIEDLSQKMLLALSLKDFEKKVYIKNAKDFAISNFNLEKYAFKLYEQYINTIDNYEKQDNKSDLFLQRLNNRYKKLENNKKTAIKDRKIEAKNTEQLWNGVINSCENLYEYLLKKGYRNIAIYGMGHFGCQLYDLLQKSGCKIEFVMDNNQEVLSEIFPTYKMGDRIPEADVIIVTVSRFQNEIKKKLQMNYSIDIITIDELLEGGV